MDLFTAAGRLALPSAFMSLLDLPVVELAARVRRGSLSAVELLEAHVARIAVVNPLINGLCAERFAEARREAEAADRLLARTSTNAVDKPLHGIPCTIKDFVAVGGMPQTAGLVSRKNFVAAHDAEVVRRLRRAGAIVVGISNVPEGGLWIEAFNRVYGRTNNPWDLSRTSGGSSGGEAALVASGASPVGLGTDIGGSIRIPSGMCGTVGHKPSGRLVPNTGIWPGLAGPRSAYHVAGPIGRSVDDLDAVLLVIAGPDGVDGEMRDSGVGPLDAVPWSRVRVLPLFAMGRVRVTAPMGDGIERAATALARRGARVTPPVVKLGNALSLWGQALGVSEGPGYPELLGDGAPIAVGRELVKLALGRSPHTAPALLVAALEALGGSALKRLNPAAAIARMQSAVEEELGDDGVLLHVPYMRVAPKHGAPVVHPFDCSATCLFTVQDRPATDVPVGFHEGMPVAVQIIGRRGNDALTLSVARALERDLGGWRRANPN